MEFGLRGFRVSVRQGRPAACPIYFFGVSRLWTVFIGGNIPSFSRVQGFLKVAAVEVEFRARPEAAQCDLVDG